MGIQIKRIGHVGILVSDFERSLKFYTEVMGCKVTSLRERPNAKGAFLRFDETHHDFVWAPFSPALAGWSKHLRKYGGKTRLSASVMWAF